MDLGHTGHGALVTGGNRGIGKAVAAALVREGAVVVLLGRDPATLADAASEVGAARRSLDKFGQQGLIFVKLQFRFSPPGFVAQVTRGFGKGLRISAC